MIFLNTKWLTYLKFRKYVSVFFIIGALLIISSLIGMQIPLVISRLYEFYNETDSFLYWIKFALFLFIIQYLVRTSYQAILGNYLKNLLQDLRSDLYSNWIYAQDKIINKDNHFLAAKKYTRGEFQARLMSDTEAVRELISSGSLTILIDFFFIFSCMFSFLKIDTFYGVVLILIESFICITLLYLSKFMGRQYAKVRTLTGRLSRVISNICSGFSQIFYTHHKNYPKTKVLPTFENFLKQQLKANLFDASYYSFAESLFPILLAIVVLIFPYSQITNIAIFAAIIDLIQRSIGPIKDVASKVSALQRAYSGITRIIEFDSDLKKYSRARTKGSDDFKKSEFIRIKVENFRYPESDFILGPLDFIIYKNKSLGILGKSGCGKSSLLKILSGEIFSDSLKIEYFNEGKEKKNYRSNNINSISTLRSNISLISQDSYIFTETIIFNLTLSNNPDMEKFNKFWEEIKLKIPYIKKWGIDPFDIIKPLDLSLGQKQLISALRFCYEGKPIALFDEISSSLDGELEEALSQFIKFIEKERFLIFVAHRIETIVNCEQILFLSNGKQVACDKHSILYQKSQEYKEFFNLLTSSNE